MVEGRLDRVSGKKGCLRWAKSPISKSRQDARAENKWNSLQLQLFLFGNVLSTSENIE